MKTENAFIEGQYATHKLVIPGVVNSTIHMCVFCEKVYAQQLKRKSQQTAIT